MEKETIKELIESCLKDGIENLPIEDICRSNKITYLTKESISKIDFSKPTQIELFELLINELFSYPKEYKIVRLILDLYLAISNLNFKEHDFEKYIQTLNDSLKIDFSLFSNEYEKEEAIGRIYFRLYQGYKTLDDREHRLEALNKSCEHVFCCLKPDNPKRPLELYTYLLICLISESSTYEKMNEAFLFGKALFDKNMIDESAFAELNKEFGRNLFTLNKHVFDRKGIEALEYAIKIFSKHDDQALKTSLVGSYFILAHFYHDKNKYDLAVQNAIEAYEIAKNMNQHPDNIANILGSLVAMTLDAKNIDYAEHYCSEFMLFVNEHDVKLTPLLHAYECYAEMFKLKDDYKEAIKTFEELLGIIDSLKDNFDSLDSYYSKLGEINFRSFLLYLDFDHGNPKCIPLLRSTIECYRDIKNLSDQDAEILSYLVGIFKNDK